MKNYINYVDINTYWVDFTFRLFADIGTNLYCCVLADILDTNYLKSLSESEFESVITKESMDLIIDDYNQIVRKANAYIEDNMLIYKKGLIDIAFMSEHNSYTNCCIDSLSHYRDKAYVQKIRKWFKTAFQCYMEAAYFNIDFNDITKDFAFLDNMEIDV